MRLFYKFNLVLVILSFFFSCNLFFSSPHGRENLDDDAAQITAFTAVPSSDNFVVTMLNWKEPPVWLNDERITEIKIQHSILGYPDNYIFFAGETFTNNSIWQYEWTDLIPGITHYFSLFAKVSDNDKGDFWCAPLKAKVKLPGTLKSDVFGFTQSLQVNDPGPPYVEAKTTLITIDNGAGPWSVLVVELDLPEDIYIVSATIETGVAGSIETTSQLRVFPVTRFWDEDPNSSEGYRQLVEDWRDDYSVDDSVSAVIGIIDPTINDVTEVIRKAVLYQPKQIVFKIDGSGGSSVDVYNTSFLNIDYISN